VNLIVPQIPPQTLIDLDHAPAECPNRTAYATDPASGSPLRIAAREIGPVLGILTVPYRTTGLGEDTAR